MGDADDIFAFSFLPASIQITVFYIRTKVAFGNTAQQFERHGYFCSLFRMCIYPTYSLAICRTQGVAPAWYVSLSGSGESSDNGVKVHALVGVHGDHFEGDGNK